MRNIGGSIVAGVVALIALSAMSVASVFAETATEDEYGALQDEINQRKAEIDDINRRLEEYRTKISSLSKQTASLVNDVAMIENQAAMAELDIAATQTEIEAQQLELTAIEEHIRSETQRLEGQREMLSALLFSLNEHESQGVVATMFGAESFHEAFDTLAQLEEVNSTLAQSVDATKQARANLEADKAELDVKIATLTDLETQLEERAEKLEHQQTAKQVLLAQTADSEAEYRTLMSELRQEQQYISNQISRLQHEVESKIDDADLAGDSSIITWPLHGVITALFHDTSYPFRHLFEHSGLDIAVPVGTSIGAAAPGYVAWAQTGRSYGNYVMIIHSNGIATLYAHMSRIDVVPDQFVSRGQQIGLSGGKPGMQGAGLSTGAHLHFEVRKDGIPVDPLSYLQSE